MTKTAKKRGRPRKPMVGDRKIIWDQHWLKESTRRSYAGVIETFNEHCRALNRIGDSFLPEEVFRCALGKCEGNPKTKENVQGVFSTIVNFLLSQGRLGECPYGERQIANFRRNLGTICKGNEPRKQAVYGAGAFLTLEIDEQDIILLMTLSGLRVAAAESLWPGNLWETWDYETNQTCLAAYSTVSKTVPDYEGPHEDDSCQISQVRWGCNCCKQYGDKFCLLCKGRWKRIQLPIKQGRIAKILQKINCNPHSTRRTAIMTIRAYFAFKAQPHIKPDLKKLQRQLLWGDASAEYFSYSKGYNLLEDFNFIPLPGVVVKCIKRDANYRICSGEQDLATTKGGKIH